MFASSPTTHRLSNIEQEYPEREDMKERLDPVSFLAMIALMKYLPLDTKLHLGDYCITTSHSNEYTYGFNFRWASRKYSGDSRQDLALIRPAIKKVANWHHLHKEENVQVREFMGHVAEGIKVLQETYKKYPLARDALKFYIRKIEDYKKKASSGLRQPLNKVTRKVKKLWNETEIQELNSWLQKMEVQQKGTPIKDKILCQDTMEQYENKLRIQFNKVKRIYEK